MSEGGDQTAPRKRDLSGFGLAPSDPNVPAPARAPDVRPARHRARPARTRSASHAKKRITLSLPTQVAVKLRRAAEQHDRFYLDLVLEAFVEHAAAVEADLAGSPSKPRRRAAGRTQIPLNILPEDLAVLDAGAEQLDLDRSAYVTELLTRAFV